MLNRRRMLVGVGTAVGSAAVVAGGVLGAWPIAARAQAAAPTAPSGVLPEATRAALGESDLVYITALKGDVEGRCHAEVWFVHLDGVPWVVTDAKSWRVRAIRAGNDRVRMWVGDFGVWKDAGDRYRQAPSLVARGSIVADAAMHERVLEAFGDKYTLEWLVWRSRFRDGLADGSRLLLRYTPV
jgi:hypothetical protein